MMNMNTENRINNKELAVISGGQGNINSIPDSKYSVGDHIIVCGDFWNDNARILDKKYHGGTWWYQTLYDSWYMAPFDYGWVTEKQIKGIALDW